MKTAEELHDLCDCDGQHTYSDCPLLDALRDSLKREEALEQELIDTRNLSKLRHDRAEQAEQKLARLLEKAKDLLLHHSGTCSAFMKWSNCDAAQELRSELDALRSK